MQGKQLKASLPWKSAFQKYGCCSLQVNHIPRVMTHALQSTELEKDYQECWAGLKSHFNAGQRDTVNVLEQANGDSH